MRRLGGAALAIAIAALVAGLLTAIALPPGALASRGLETGFGSHYYQSADPDIRARWLSRTVDAGGELVKLNLQWYNVARFARQRPADAADPRSAAYDFSWVDDSVTDASARGLRTLLLVGGTPHWAEAPGRPPEVNPIAWNPIPSDLADFMRAIATRYSGNFDPDGAGPGGTLPPIAAVEVWNEPNASGSLSPQFHGKADAAAPIYRRMLNASYDAVKAINPNLLVVAGGTDPYGAPPGGPYPPDLQMVPPVTFWQDLLCVHRVKRKAGRTRGRGAKVRTKFARSEDCPAPAKFDVLAHHPVNNTGAGPLAHGPLPGDVTTPDLGKIVDVLRAGEKAGTTLPGRHQVWVTEFWWDSRPPNTSGAGLAKHARWIQQSLYLFWKAGASAAINLVIGDADYLNNLRGGYQSGAYFRDGRPKPALTAFRFPFVTDRAGSRHLRAWGRSPTGGELVIQRRAAGRWRNLRTIRVEIGAVFSAKLRLQGRQRLRAKVGPLRSLVWKQR